MKRLVIQLRILPKRIGPSINDGICANNPPVYKNYTVYVRYAATKFTKNYNTAKRPAIAAPMPTPDPILLTAAIFELVGVAVAAGRGTVARDAAEDTLDASDEDTLAALAAEFAPLEDAAVFDAEAAQEATVGTMMLYVLQRPAAN